MLPTKSPSAAGSPKARATAMPTAFCVAIVAAIAAHISATWTPPFRRPANLADRPSPAKNTSSRRPRTVPGHASSTPGQLRAIHASDANTSPPVTAGGMPEDLSAAIRSLIAAPARIATIASTNIASSETAIVTVAIGASRAGPAQPAR